MSLKRKTPHKGAVTTLSKLPSSPPRLEVVSYEEVDELNGSNDTLAESPPHPPSSSSSPEERSSSPPPSPSPSQAPPKKKKKGPQAPPPPSQEKKDWYAKHRASIRADMKKVKVERPDAVEPSVVIAQLKKETKKFYNLPPGTQVDFHESYILPLFTFLGKGEVKLEVVKQTDDGKYIAKCQDAKDFIEGLSREKVEGSEDYMVKEEEICFMLEKFGRTWWKIPKKGMERGGLVTGDLDALKGSFLQQDPKRVDGKEGVTCRLIGVCGQMTQDGTNKLYIKPILHFS
jgi:hypothetical protein